MIQNQKYSSYKVIYGRLAAMFKNKPLNEDDIMEWCAECETDYIRDTRWMVRFEQVGLTVTNHVAELPCNVHRILDVYYTNQRVNYFNDGSYLRLPNTFPYDTIYINYLGVPIDDHGIPLILRGHEQACEAFCIWKMNYEAYLLRQIDTGIFMQLEDRMNVQVQAARNGWQHRDREDVNKDIIIMGNMIPKIGSLTLAHQAFINSGPNGLSNT